MQIDARIVSRIPGVPLPLLLTLIAVPLLLGACGDDNGNGTTDPDQEGACCRPNLSCTVTTQAACTADNGIYMGNGTDCDPNPCPL